MSKPMKGLVAFFALAIIAAGIRYMMLPNPVRQHVEVVSVLDVAGGWFNKYGRGRYVHHVRLPDGRRIRLGLSHAYQPGDLVNVGFLEYERSRSAYVLWETKCARPCLTEETGPRTTPKVHPPR